MTEKEKKLTKDLLEIASDQFSNNGCNDVDDELYNGWTLEERKHKFEFKKHIDERALTLTLPI